MNCKGLVHIYFGDGKGKTTASVGLAVRCAGAGGKVLFSQFMKDGSSSEISVLKQIDGITVTDGYSKAKFTRFMTDEEHIEAREYYSNEFERVTKKAEDEKFDLLILDELINAVDKNYVELDKVIEFIENKPEGLEIVMTGRNPDRKLFDYADYVSDVIKIKHPFDKGIGSRLMIEK